MRNLGKGFCENKGIILQNDILISLVAHRNKSDTNFDVEMPLWLTIKQ